MPLFDRIVMVDWSAAAVPTTGADSIWIADVAVGGAGTATLSNPATRADAMQTLRGLAQRSERLLIGFDFAFGYPRGTSQPFGGGWRAIWSWLSEEVADADSNKNNRFDVAARFNGRFPEGEGPLWGLPRNRSVSGVRPTRPREWSHLPPERRSVERLVPRTQPTGKLAYPGSVGSQTLLGIARLEAWRSDRTVGSRTVIWPFETDFAEKLGTGIVIAEIFPSLHPIQGEVEEVRDRAQVRTLAKGYAGLDQRNALIPHLAGPMDKDVRTIALHEEGWIMSVTDEILPLAA